MATQAGWAVLGPGGIARRFLAEIGHSEGAIVAVGSSDAGRARTFADEAEAAGAIDVTAGTYAEALADPRVDAVYISTVHTGHADLLLAAVAAGKAVLCEKPLSPNLGTTMALVEAARAGGVPLVEAYMYRFHPRTQAVLQLVRDGAIGRVTHVDASFSFRVGERGGRLFDPATAGGGILDVGGYPATFTSAIVDAATGAHASEPIELTAAGTVGPTGVDEWATAHATYRDGITATLRCGVRVDDPRVVTIHGERGRITVDDPWVRTGDTTIEVSTVDETRTIEIPAASATGLEADATIAALRAGDRETAAMTTAETLATARTLDRWRAAIGVRFPFEAEDADIAPVTGRTIRPHQTETMRYGRIDGIDKPISRLVLGVDNQPDLAHASAIFDHWIEAGGNAFDTAHLYGSGSHEARLGRWLENRGIRDEVVIITKGAHTPDTTPEGISRQLIESLERQRTEYADLYLMHRDDERVPVGEFVDVLDEHHRAGRIRAFGVSNWTPERFDAANAYAAANGRAGFTALSNHFGLAEAQDVPWAGCVHSTDGASKAWLAERGIALFPWSSQARGFFARADADDLSDAELVRCYYSDGNFERLRRARKLAADRGVPPTAIALAYVLHQPFPTFPLIGPRMIEESRTSLLGLSIELTPDEVAWLDLQS